MKDFPPTEGFAGFMFAAVCILLILHGLLGLIELYTANFLTN